MLDFLLKKKWFYPLYIWSLFAGAVAIVLTGHQISGAILFGLIASAALFAFSDPTGFLVPSMLLSVFVTVCYDSYNDFIALWPYSLALAAGFIFNALKYRRKIKIGPSFYGLVAVSVAVTLGGLGSISKKEYFSPTSIYYVVMLGVGMLLVYLLFSSKMKPESRKAVAQLMYAVGLLAAFILLHNYCINWDIFVSTHKPTQLQANNNLSTFLLLAMPFPMYYARKRHVDVICSILMFCCAVISASRGGILMGIVEITVLLVVFALFFERSKVKKLFYFLLTASFVCAFIYFIPQIKQLAANTSLDITQKLEISSFADIINLVRDSLFKSGEARHKLLKQAVLDFKSNPLFGVGIGYTGNSHLYSPVAGAMNWYHVWIAQVVAGLGIVGALAYGYQLISRFVIYFKNRSPLNMTFLMSYIGLFLMSQVNPGEFCPVPYGLIAVVYFIIIEQTPKSKIKNKKHKDK